MNSNSWEEMTFGMGGVVSLKNYLMKVETID